jgi:hypothetical protein
MGYSADFNADGRAQHPVVRCCQRCGTAGYYPKLPIPGNIVYCSLACQWSTAPLNYRPDPTPAQVLALRAQHGATLAARYPQRHGERA